MPVQHPPSLIARQRVGNQPPVNAQGLPKTQELPRTPATAHLCAFAPLREPRAKTVCAETARRSPEPADPPRRFAAHQFDDRDLDGTRTHSRYDELWARLTAEARAAKVNVPPGLRPATSVRERGLHQPGGRHRHWHVALSHLNVCGTFYQVCSVVDGYNRCVVHWETRKTMFESDAAIVIQRAREKSPGEKPPIISDDGPQFVAKDFMQSIRLCGMAHVTTSPYYPQGSRKKERWFGTLRRERIRPGTPLSLDDARRLVTRFVEHCNTVRLHSAVGYVTPGDKLSGPEHGVAIGVQPPAASQCVGVPGPGRVCRRLCCCRVRSGLTLRPTGWYPVCYNYRATLISLRSCLKPVDTFRFIGSPNVGRTAGRSCGLPPQS
jgi:transposase InsO family protein